MTGVPATCPRAGREAIKKWDACMETGAGVGIAFGSLVRIYPPGGAVYSPAIRPGIGFPVPLNDGCGLNVGCAVRIEPGYQYKAFCRSVDSKAHIMSISVLGLWPGGYASLRGADEVFLAILGRLKSGRCPVLTFVECHGIFYLAIL